MSRWSGQLHGHLHSNVVMDGDKPDKRYVNVCVEHHNFRPVLLNDMLAQVKELNTA
jgi:calcineurin-like phosphoesterase family protein